MNRAQYLKELGLTIYSPFGKGGTRLSLPPFLIFVIDPTEANHPLLHKIIDAIALPPEAISICFPHNIPSQIKNRIIFGKDTLSLDELVKNDAAKRALWQQLKSIKAAYGN